MTFDYESWIQQAKDRLEVLYQQREAINEEIANLERGIKGFAPLVKSLWIGPSTGITDSIRQVFKTDPQRVFSPTEIRNELLKRGVELKQENPMATIHQVLARLREQGDVEPYVTEGRPRYKWAREVGNVERRILREALVKRTKEAREKKE